MKKFVLAVVASVMLVSSAAVPVLAEENAVQASQGISAGENQTEKELLECIKYYHDLEIHFDMTYSLNGSALDILSQYINYDYSKGDGFLVSYINSTTNCMDSAKALKNSIDTSVQNASPIQKERLAEAQRLVDILVNYAELEYKQIALLKSLRATDSDEDFNASSNIISEITKSVVGNASRSGDLFYHYYGQLYEMFK